MGNNLVAGTLVLVPAFEQISIYASYTGDDNGNASSYVEYRQAGGSWIRGVNLIADRRPNLVEFVEGDTDRITPNPYYKQFRGIIFGITPQTTYEVMVTIADPDGVSGSPISGLVTTRNDNPPSNGDIKTATPITFASIVAGAQPGDIIHLAPGTYAGDITVMSSGQPNNYITIESADPSNRAIITGGLRNIWLRGNYIRLRNLVCKNATGDAGPNVQVGWDNGIVATGNIIEGCELVDPSTTWASAGVLIRNSRDTLIQDNLIRITAVGVRGQQFGIFFWGSFGGVVIRRNTILGNGSFRDGIGGAGNFQISAGPGPDSFIYENYIHGSYDDGIESEGGNMCVAIFNNRLEPYIGGGSASWEINGIGIASIVVGPLYAIGNLIVAPREGGFKAGSSSYGYGRLYHNTIYNTGYGLLFSSGNNRICENIDSRNNIVYSPARVMGHYTDTIPIGQQTNTYDYDCLYAVGDWFGFFYGIRYEMMTSLKVAGHELNGIDANPLFVAPATQNGDFRLQAGSPAIGSGMVIPGINTPGSLWAFRDSAPDMGAIEYGVLTMLTIELRTSPGGTTNPTPAFYSVLENSIFTAIAQPSSGYHFDGWYKNGVLLGSNLQLSLIVTSSIAIEAKFSPVPVTYDLTLVTGVGGAIDPIPGTYSYLSGSQVDITAIPAEGYYFVQWEVNGIQDTRNPLPLVLNADIIVLAFFELVPVTQYVITITAMLGGRTSPAPGAYIVDAGSRFSVTANPSSGYEFDHWEGDTNDTMPSTSFDVNGNMSIVAIFRELSPSPTPDTSPPLVSVIVAIVIPLIAILMRKK